MRFGSAAGTDVRSFVALLGRTIKRQHFVGLLLHFPVSTGASPSGGGGRVSLILSAMAISSRRAFNVEAGLPSREPRLHTVVAVLEMRQPTALSTFRSLRTKGHFSLPPPTPRAIEP